MYADPISLLNIYIATDKLQSGIIQILEDSNEEKLWQLYVARSGSLMPFEGSFNEYKNQIIPTPQQEGERISLDDAKAQAEDILSRCNPRKGKSK